MDYEIYQSYVHFSLQVKDFLNYIPSKSKQKWDKQIKLLFPDLFLVLITVSQITEVKRENNLEISHLFCLQCNSLTEEGFTEGSDKILSLLSVLYDAVLYKRISWECQCGH